jgi:alcohol dehydrogenase class IV
MNPFVFHSPTQVSFGESLSSTAADVLREYGGKKPLVITDEFLYKSGMLDSILTEVRYVTGEAPHVFYDVPPDSEIATVNKAAVQAREFGCDSFIAVGGGSVLDTTKVVNICVSLGGELLQYQGLNNIIDRLKPMLAIPTTAGTGSEVTMVAMVKDAAESKKMLFGSRFLAPDVAILDPTLILSLPPKLTAATGLDAITHCIESYSSILSSSPITEGLCLEALRLLFKYIPIATAHGDDMEARSATLVASTMAGVAFTNSGVGIVHALAHSTGARYNTHHGATNAVFLPHCMRFNEGVVTDRFACIARFLGLSDSRNDDTASRALIDAIEKLSASVGLPPRLRDLGVPSFTVEVLEELAEASICDPAIMFNPRDSTKEEIISLYQSAY